MTPCAFREELDRTRARIQASLDSLPETIWPECRDRILLPLMRRIALFDPNRRMALEWLDASQPLPGSVPISFVGTFRHADRLDIAIKLRFWEICPMLRSDIVRWMGGGFFTLLEQLANSILSLIVKVERHPEAKEEGYAAIWLQVKLLLGNEDRILQLVDEVASSKRRRSWNGFVDYFALCGCLDYALHLALNITGQRQAVMRDFARQIQARIDREAEMRLLLCMRGGIGGLGSDLLHHIIIELQRQNTVAVRWEQILFSA